jgi:hypothetical protein
MERARWWTSSSCGLPTRATAARALTRGGEDSDDGLCGWDQAEAAATKALSISPPPMIDGVEKLYHQLAEIHAIIVA